MPLVLIKSDPRAREKPCLRCGYSLRKILDARNCPECGLSVWISLNNNDSLDWSRPDWLRVLSVAALVMAGAQVVGMAAGVAVVVPWVLGFLVSMWIEAAYMIGLGGGMILLATPERRYPDELKSHRWFLMVAGVLQVLLGLALAGYAAMGRLAPLRWYWTTSLMQIAMLIGAIATLLYLRKLAHRLGATRLAKWLGWMLLIPLLKFVQGYPLWGLYLGYRMIAIGEMLPWIYLPLSLGILIYLGIAFRGAAKAAEANWASAG